MIAHRTFDAFDALLASLPFLAPPDDETAPVTDAPEGFLSPEAMPPDPAHAAIIAVIDHAIPFAHHLLTTAGGHSRVAALWMQDAPVSVPRPDIPFGREIRGVEIDHLRGIGTSHPGDEDAVYRQLGLMDAANPRGRWYLRAASHGAAVACTAAGYPAGDRAGRAFPLIGVGLPDWALADTSGGAMPYLLQSAVVFIIARARALAREIRPNGRVPLVINISLGVTAGARDGQSLIEAMQDAICAAPPPELGPVQFVLATGNTRQNMLCAQVAPRETIGWRILPDDGSLSECQIWTPVLAPGCAPIALRLTLPDGSRAQTAFAPPSGPGAQIAYLRDGAGRELARLVLQAVARPGGLRQCLTIIVPPSVASNAGMTPGAPGTWALRLRASTPAPCAVVIQRDDRLPGFPGVGRQSVLVDPRYHVFTPQGRYAPRDHAPPDTMVRRDGTCNAFAWGTRQIRCGADLMAPRVLTQYGGLLADGAAGDVVAAGDRGVGLRGMISPAMRGCAVQDLSGTSIAAPQLTRWLAACLAQGMALDDRAAVVAALAAAYPAPVGDVPSLPCDVPWGRAPG